MNKKLKARIKEGYGVWNWELLSGRMIVCFNNRRKLTKKACIEELQYLISSIREGDVPLFEERTEIASDVNAYGD